MNYQEYLKLKEQQGKTAEPTASVPEPAPKSNRLLQNLKTFKEKAFAPAPPLSPETRARVGEDFAKAWETRTPYRQEVKPILPGAAGRFEARTMERAGQIVAPGGPNYAPSTGSKAADVIADLLGTGLGFTQPGGAGASAMQLGKASFALPTVQKGLAVAEKITPAASKLAGKVPTVLGKTVAAKAAQAIPKVIETAARGATSGAAFGAGEAISREEPLHEALKTIGKESALWAGIDVGAAMAGPPVVKGLSKAGVALWERLPATVKDAILKRFPEKKVAEVVEQAASKGPDWYVDEFGNVMRRGQVGQLKLPSGERLALPPPQDEQLANFLKSPQGKARIEQEAMAPAFKLDEMIRTVRPEVNALISRIYVPGFRPQGEQMERMVRNVAKKYGYDYDAVMAEARRPIDELRREAEQKVRLGIVSGVEQLPSWPFRAAAEPKTVEPAIATRTEIVKAPEVVQKPVVAELPKPEPPKVEQPKAKPTKAKEPWEMTKEEFAKQQDSDDYIWVYHATDVETANQMAKEGILRSNKPSNLARERYFAGQQAEFAPGRGLASGLTVGSEPYGVEGYGRQIVAVKVPRKSIKVSPEQEALGVKDSAEALRVNDAFVDADIPASNIRLIGNVHTTPREGHREFVASALNAGKPVPPEVLKDYPGLMPKAQAKVEAPKAETKLTAQEVTPKPSATKRQTVETPSAMGEKTSLGSEVYIQARKNPGGFYQLFYLDTRNEIFPGEKFRTAQEARSYFKAMKAKETSQSIASETMAGAGTPAGGVQSFAGPHPGSPQFAIQQAGEPVRAHGIVKFLSEQFNLPIRTGRFIQQALGIFKPKEQVVRSWVADDLQTISHEVGHYLDDQLKLKSPFYDAELMPLGQKTSKPTYTPDQVRAEGVAEFTRLYLSNPAEAQRVAPSYFKAFESQLPDDAKRILKSAQEGIVAFYKQDPVTKMKSMINKGVAKERKSIRELLDEAYTAAIDDLHPLWKFVKEVGGENIPVSKDPYILERLRRGWAGRAETYIKRGIVNEKGNVISKGLEETLKPIRDNADDFWAYALARRSAEQYSKGSSPLGNNFSAKEVQEVVSRLENKPGFKQAFDDLQTYQGHILKQLADAGMLSPEQYNIIREMNLAYIPMQRVFDPEIIRQGFGAEGVANISSPIRKAKGSGREIVDPMETIIKNTFILTNLAERNKVARAVVDLAEGVKGSGLWVEKVPMKVRPTEFTLKEIEKTLWDAGADLTEADLDAIARVFRPASLSTKDVKEGVLAVYKNGKPQLYQVDPTLYRIMTAADQGTASVGMRLLTNALAIPARLLRAGATLNPRFIARNILRDPQSAAVYSTYAKNPLLAFVDIPKAISHVVKKDDLYWKWKSTGGAHGALVSLDRDYLQGAARGILEDPSLTSKVKNLVLHPIELLRALSEGAEEVTRVSEFQRGLRAGGGTLDDVLNAAFASREVTLDFARAGYVGREFNKATAFFNAALQGTDKLAREIKRDPKGVISKALLTVTLPSVVLWWMNKDDPRYQQAAQWEKDLFWLVPTKNTMYRVPKPFELGVIFGTFPERLLQAAYADDPTAFDGFGKSITDAALPSIVPTAMVPWLEAWGNKSFFSGYNIVPEREMNLPKELQYGPRQTEPAKAIGKALNVSPRVVENTVRGLTGNLGMDALDIANWATRSAGADTPVPKPEEGVKGWPVVGGLVKGFTTESYLRSPKSEQQFYDEFDMLKQKFNAAKEGKGTMAYDEYQKYLLLNAISKNLSEANKAARTIEVAGNLTPEQKRQGIDRVDAYKADLTRQVMEAVRRRVAK